MTAILKIKHRLELESVSNFLSNNRLRLLSNRDSVFFMVCNLTLGLLFVSLRGTLPQVLIIIIISCCTLRITGMQNRQTTMKRPEQMMMKKVFW